MHPPDTSNEQKVDLPPIADQPTVSILVPSYNQGQFIGDTIDSILQQDYRPLKIFVVDGASTDQTVDVLKGYGDIPELDWVSEPDKGVVDAVNKGFARIKGDILGIQSSDDMYTRGAIQKVVDEFRASPTTGLIYGDTIKVDADGKEILKYQTSEFSLENLFLFRTWIPQPSAFFRSEMLQCGNWDEGIPYAPDTDLWIRMAFRADVKKIDQYLSQRRMHDAQRDTQGQKIIRDFCKMIDQSPDIAGAPDDVRNAARAAKHLIRLRYEEGADWKNAWSRYQAGKICPEIANTGEVARFLMLPARRVLSKIKRAVVGQAK